MITEGIDATKLFVSLDETWTELTTALNAANESFTNTIPFKDSWTIAQLATHVTKSNKAIAQGLQMEGSACERDPGGKVAELKKIFLDFTVKFQSPEFIVPEQKDYNKVSVIEALEKSIAQLKEESVLINLSEIISLPVFGEITKLELLYFVLYHTKRHNHQLKNILKELQSDTN